MKISDDVFTVLNSSRIDENQNILFLPDIQLERKLYVAVNKCLESIGGKWNRGAKGHIFDHNPSDDLDEMINTGEWTDKKKVYQYFPTPKNIGEKLIQFADIQDSDILLEPSAGKGAIFNLFPSNNTKVAIELMHENCEDLKKQGYNNILEMDFLNYAEQGFDKIIMNPPFSGQQDVKHIFHAWSLLKEGGKLVSIVSESPFFRNNELSKKFRDFLNNNNSRTIPLSSETFKESGTMVKTRIIVVDKNIAS
jgi:hypothetical protein